MCIGACSPCMLFIFKCCMASYCDIRDVSIMVHVLFTRDTLDVPEVTLVCLGRRCLSTPSALLRFPIPEHPKPLPDPGNWYSSLRSHDQVSESLPVPSAKDFSTCVNDFRAQFKDEHALKSFTHVEMSLGSSLNWSMALHLVEIDSNTMLGLKHYLIFLFSIFKTILASASVQAKHLPGPPHRPSKAAWTASFCAACLSG